MAAVEANDRAEMECRGEGSARAAPLRDGLQRAARSGDGAAGDCYGLDKSLREVHRKTMSALAPTPLAQTTNHAHRSTGR